MSKPKPANVKTRQVSCPREIDVKRCSTQAVRILGSCGEERGRKTPCFTSTITKTDNKPTSVFAQITRSRRVCVVLWSEAGRKPAER